MTSISAFSAGLQSVATATAQIDRSAVDIARETTGLAAPSAPSMEQSLVNQQEAKTYALAGVKVIEAADEVIGTLLDIRA